MRHSFRFSRSCVAPLRRDLLLALCTVAVCPHVVAGQSPPDTARVVAGPPVAAWISIELGSGKLHYAISGPLAAVGRVNVSIGRIVVAYRATDIGPFLGDGNGVRDFGVLGGVRTADRRVFGSASVGVTRAHRYHSCFERCGISRTSSNQMALAYDLSGNANRWVPGVSASISGVVGRRDITYVAATLGVDLGWFGL